MGNNNSTNSNSNNIGFLDQLFGNDDDEIKSSAVNTGTNPNIYNKADQLYDQIFYGNTANTKAYSNNYIKRTQSNNYDTYVDSSRGISMPYIADKRSYESDSDDNSHDRRVQELLLTSDNPRYIEFIVCKETFGLDKSDAKCRQETYEMNGNNIRNYNGPTTKASNEDTSDQLLELKKKLNKTANVSGINAGSMYGGAGKNNDDTSPEEITDSDEIFDTDTSEMSDTTDGLDTVDKNVGNDRDGKKKSKAKKNGDNDSTSDSDIIDEDDDDNDDDDDLDVDLDEELEGLEEEENIENGFVLDQSDDSSSDLYNMHRLLFESETDTEYDYNGNDDDMTEDIRQAMDQIEARRNNARVTARTNRTQTNRNNRTNKGTIFDSEDEKIMGMNSSTDDYMKRPIRRNNKYY